MREEKGWQSLLQDNQSGTCVSLPLSPEREREGEMRGGRGEGGKGVAEGRSEGGRNSHTCTPSLSLLSPRSVMAGVDQLSEGTRRQKWRHTSSQVNTYHSYSCMCCTTL